MKYRAETTRYEDMEYRRCGESGLALSALSLGLWHNFGQEADSQAARAMVECAFDRGITHFDLANNSGPPPGSAEERFGEILKKSLSPYRDETGHLHQGGLHDVAVLRDWGSLQYLVASLDQGLKRMGLEYVDIFYHHRLVNLPLEETMGRSLIW